MMIRKLSHLATRIFETPLMIHQAKLDTILQVLGPRLGLDSLEIAPESEARLRADQRSARPAESPVSLAVIPIVGPLVKRASGDALSGGPTTYQEIGEAFQAALNDDSINGILLDIDSPGGEVAGLFDLTLSIYEARGKKPIYSIANDSAFSGGYALASAAERAFVTQTGGMGSIGVLAVHVDQSKLDADIGLKYEFITAGAKKAQFNSHEPLSDAARADLQAEIDRIYGMFTRDVAKYRSLKVAQVKGTEAGLYYGENAVTEGLADEVGTFESALEALAEAATSRSKNRSLSAAASAAPIPQKESNTTMQQITTEADAGLNASAAPVVDDPATPALPETPDQPQDSIDPPVDEEDDDEIDPDAKAGEPPKTLATADEILELCAIAGRGAAFAADLLKKKLTTAEVRQHLIQARRDEEPGGIRSHVLLSKNVGEHLTAASAELAKREGISKEKAYVSLLEKNPQLYEQHLQQQKQKRLRQV